METAELVSLEKIMSDIVFVEKDFGIDEILKFGVLFGVYFFFQGFSYEIGFRGNTTETNFYSVLFNGFEHLSHIRHLGSPYAMPVIPWFSGILLLYVPFFSAQISKSGNERELYIFIAITALVLSVWLFKGWYFLLPLVLVVLGVVRIFFVPVNALWIPSCLCSSPWKEISTVLIAGTLVANGAAASFVDGQRDKQNPSVQLCK